jgi:hypothetical protein
MSDAARRVTPVRSSDAPPAPARRSRLILLAIAAATIWALTSRPGEEGAPGQHAAGEDRKLHSATIARLHDGEPYYVVVGDELRQRGFPAASVFNWRTPLLYSVIALQPMAARSALVLLGLLVLVATARLLITQPLPVVIGGAIAQSGAIGVIFDPTAWVFHEVWTGLLVALSAFSYAGRRWTTGALLGLIALFVRELAAPYVAVCAVVCWRMGRRREMAVWLSGLSLYAVHYGRHYYQIAINRLPADVGGDAWSWLTFGGAPFAVTTFRTNSLLHDRPTILAVLFLVFYLSGLSARALPLHLRAAGAIYFLCFLVAGQPFNWYWGWVPGFVIPIVFAYGLRELPVMSVAAWKDTQ